MSDYSSDDYEDDEEEYVPIRLEECHKCGRKFNTESLRRHTEICKKVSKQRKVFDSRKQRLEGVGVDLKKINATSPVAQKTPKKKDWRRQHEEFIKTIRSARQVTVAQKTGSELPPPPSPTFNPDYVQCPHCQRRFNENAAERHINFCKEQKSRLPRQTSDSKFSVKKEKMQIRQQYKPPMPGQKKKSIDSSPVKARGGSYGYGSSPGSKPDSSPGAMRRNVPLPDKKSKSDASVGSRKKAHNVDEERPIHQNSRYSKSGSGFSSGGSDNEKPRSGKNRNGDPKWFEDLKRHDSGKQSRSPQRPDEPDSGMDLDENYTYRKKHPVGVVRPSSRTKEIADDKNTSAGRRKMANFCHDCGTKYPVTNAKFCCECGVRRMALT